MTVTVARWEDMEWERGGHQLERKKPVPGRGVVLLELAPGFSDPLWCQRSHVIQVLEGTLELELDEGGSMIATGECAVVDWGTRHRARNPGATRAVALVVSDVWAPQ